MRCGYRLAAMVWDRYLQHAQQRLQSTGLDQKLVAVGVWVHPPVGKQVAHELVHQHLPRRDDHPSPRPRAPVPERQALDQPHHAA